MFKEFLIACSLTAFDNIQGTENIVNATNFLLLNGKEENRKITTSARILYACHKEFIHSKMMPAIKEFHKL